MSVLVDTCVWSRFLRRGRDLADPVVEHVARLIRADAVRVIGPIRQEILSGAQPDARFEMLKEYLRYYPNLAMDESDDETAAAFYNVCRRRGVHGSGTDFLICAVSVRHRLKVFTTDTDFVSYAKHIPIKLYRLARQG